MTNIEIKYWHDLTKFALEMKSTNSGVMKTLQRINRKYRSELNKRVSIHDYLDFSSVRKVITPNITNSEQDVTILNKFMSLFDEITHDVKAFYYDNMLIPDSDKPKSIQYLLYLTNIQGNFTISGSISIFKSDSTRIKNIPIENIIASKNFNIKNTRELSDIFYVDYNIDNELKDIILEALIQNQHIIGCIQKQASV